MSDANHRIVERSGQPKRKKSKKDQDAMEEVIDNKEKKSKKSKAEPKTDEGDKVPSSGTTRLVEKKSRRVSICHMRRYGTTCERKARLAVDDTFPTSNATRIHKLRFIIRT